MAKAMTNFLFLLEYFPQLMIYWASNEIDPYNIFRRPNDIPTIRNKNVITITVKRADYESKNPEYPGNHR